MPSPANYTAAREQWNERYRQGMHTLMEPDPLLFQLHDEFLAPLFPQAGRGLDLAGGTGRHAIWLAQQGWRMTLADLSDTATSMAASNATAMGVELDIETGPAAPLLASAASAGAGYDLIVVIQFLDRSLFPAIRAALKPGGLLLYKAHTLDHLHLGDGNGPRDAEHLLQRQELLEAFAGMRVLYYQETVTRRGTQCMLAQATQ